MSKRKYEITVEEALKWAEDHPAVKIWVSKVQRKKESAWHLWLFCKLMNKSPEQLLFMKDDPKSREVEYLLDNFVADNTLELTNSVKVKVVIAVKSYFKWNYKELARASGQIMLEKIKPYRKHSKEELLKIHRSAQNPRDRALITFTWSTAVARESLQNLQWKHLESDWEKQEIPHISLPPELLKGHGRGKYRDVRQETFLTPEAKRDLIDYKDYLERIKGQTITSENYVWVMLGQPYSQLNYGTFSKIAHDLSKRSGVPFGWHDARRYVETALEEIKISPNWAKKIRGRKIRGEESPYSRPAIEQLRSVYREAVPLLEFTQTSQPKGEDIATLAKLETLKVLAKNMGITDQQISALFAKRPLKVNAEYIKHLELMIEEKRRETENTDCTDGEHCEPLDAITSNLSRRENYEQIAENQLLQYLRNGWKIEHKLGNGEVIVRR